MRKFDKIAVIWGLTLVAIFIVLTIFAIKWKTKIELYVKKEDEIREIVKKYCEENELTPEGLETITYTKSQLKEKGIIEDFKVENKECEVVVNIKNEDTTIYEVYLKCEKYETSKKPAQKILTK